MMLMRICMFGLGVLSTSCLLSNTAAAQGQNAAPSCSLLEFASLDMLTLKDGEFAIPVNANGHVWPFLFDSGSVMTSISTEASDELGLKRGFTPGGSFLNNVAINEFAQLQELKLGPLHSSDGWQVLVIPNDMMSAGIYGFLAPDFVSLGDVEMDFFRGKFNLFKHNKCGARAVYWTRDAYAALPLDLDKTRRLYVQAWLDGKPVKVTFDTGSSGSVMSLEAARSLFGWSADDPRIRNLGVHGLNGIDTTYYGFPFAALNFNGVVVYSPMIALLPKEAFSGRHVSDTEIVLGMNVIRQLHFFIDYDAGTLYLTGAEAH